MSTIDEDARLVAFIDGELDEGARAELEARLAIDPILHERLMRLQEGGRPFAAAFDALLDDAPVQRLEAALASYIQRWRQAVAEYMTLYTPDTFATEPESQERELTALGAKIGLSLTAERVALANLQFKGGQIFGFHGAPLGQLGYVDPATGPVLFCIIRDFEPDAAMKAESRGEFAVASWARSGRGYMLIGRLPINQVAQLADSLEKRF